MCATEVVSLLDNGVYEVSSRPIRCVRKIGRTRRTISTRRGWLQDSWRGYDYAETYSPTYRDYYIPVCGAGGGGVPLNSGGDGREGAARDGPSSAEGAEGVAEDLEPAHRQSAVRVRYTHRNYVFAQRTRGPREDLRRLHGYAPSAPDQPAIKRRKTWRTASTVATCGRCGPSSTFGDSSNSQCCSYSAFLGYSARMFSTRVGGVHTRECFRREWVGFTP